MIEVVRSRLDARERYRWSVALAERALLAERPARARGPQLVAAASTYLYLAMLVVIAMTTAWDALGEAVLGALAAGGIVMAGRIALWMWHEARSRWPSGRFLFAWGYVHVEHDRLHYVAAEGMTHAIDDGVVTLRAGMWSTTFHVTTTEDLAQRLRGLGAPRIAGVVDGYRDAPWIIEGPQVAPPRFSARSRDLAWVLGVALVGGVAGHAARLVRHEPTRARPSFDYNQIAPTARMPSRVPGT